MTSVLRSTKSKIPPEIGSLTPDWHASRQRSGPDYPIRRSIAVLLGTTALLAPAAGRAAIPGGAAGPGARSTSGNPQLSKFPIYPPGASAIFPNAAASLTVTDVFIRSANGDLWVAPAGRASVNPPSSTGEQAAHPRYYRVKLSAEREIERKLALPGQLRLRPGQPAQGAPGERTFKVGLMNSAGKLQQMDGQANAGRLVRFGQNRDAALDAMARNANRAAHPGPVEFSVPQLPAGVYQAYFNAQNAVTAPPEQTITLVISPTLSSSPSVIFLHPHTPADYSVGMTGSPSVTRLVNSGRDHFRRVQELVRANITIARTAGSATDVSDGGPLTRTTNAYGEATWKLMLGRVDSTTFGATAPGFEPTSFTVESRGSGPIPIVFVPGTAGTELHFPDNSLYWIGLPTLKPGMIERGALNPDGSEGAAPLRPIQPVQSFSVDLPKSLVKTMQTVGINVQSTVGLTVHANFLAWAQSTFNKAGVGHDVFYTAPYDWRRAFVDDQNARAIDAAVDRARDASGYTKVILVGHSLGGLMCQDYLAGIGRGKVDSLVSLGTPWLGAPKTARALLWGYDFGVGKDFDTGTFMNISDGHGNTKKVPFPTHMGFIDPAAAQRVARTWPCVFEQLPTDDFFKAFGTALGGDKTPHSVVFGMLPADLIKFYRAQNPGLFDQAAKWRSQKLHNGDFGADHYLIAGIVDPNVGPADWMDMEMAQPGNVSFTADGINNSKVVAIQGALNAGALLATADGFGLFRSDYAASVGGTWWGDGTSALLSATGGAMLQAAQGFSGVAEVGDADLAAPRELLGKNTEVTVLRLQPEFGHSSLFDDPNVRNKLVSIFQARNELAGVNPDLAQPRAIGSIEVELTTKKNGEPLDDFGTFNEVTGSLMGFDMPMNTLLEGMGKLGNGSISTWDFPSPHIVDPASGARRDLLDTDSLKGKTLSLTLNEWPVTDDWVCSRVRVLVDHQVVLDSQKEFRLSHEHPTQEITIP